mgnify:CR=1 FL=1
MSVGNVTQAVTLNQDELTLVLGNNIDLGGDGSRNGTGKTTLINALSYGLYGKALTNIKQNNLINKTNGKGMMITVDFTYNGNEYRIERGRSPNVFHFMRDGMELGDLLLRLGRNSMITARRDGLTRRWVDPALAEEEKRHRHQEAADAKLARSWDERRTLFQRAQTAEDEGRLSRAIELYEALGRKDDVKRLLGRQKGGD